MLCSPLEQHFITQWGFAKGYRVTDRLYRSLWLGVRNNIV